MKWRVQEPKPLKKGDTRTRRVFAWKKTKVGDYCVWLETYQITEKYFISAGGNQAWWSEISRETLDYFY
jgi:hypothetical protein